MTISSQLIPIAVICPAFFVVIPVILKDYDYIIIKDTVMRKCLINQNKYFLYFLCIMYFFVIVVIIFLMLFILLHFYFDIFL